MSRYEKTTHQYIFKDSRSGTFYFRGTIRGSFTERSLKTNLISKAKQASDLLMLSSEDKSPERRTFDECFENLLTIQRSKSDATYDMAMYQVKHLRPWFKKHCPFVDRFVKDYELYWARYRSDQAILTPGRKLGHDRRHLVMALIRARNSEWIKREFEAKDFPLLEAVTPKGKFIEDDQVKSILKRLEGHRKIYLQVLMAVVMGMRLREILHLRKEEVDLKNREINLDPNRLKIRRVRSVPIPIADDVYPLLKQAYDDATGECVFPAQYMSLPGKPIDPNTPQDDNRYFWNQVREDTGIELRFHDLRHTAITNALAAGLPSISASKIFGATEKTIKAIYDHLKKDTKVQFRGIFNGRFQVLH